LALIETIGDASPDSVMGIRKRTVAEHGPILATSHPETRVVQRSTGDKTVLKQAQILTRKGDRRGGYRCRLS
jgi:hypothetical protein